jgi:catechol 2,3-dioxygenase-like lactoylglutathione lyase family enzyme
MSRALMCLAMLAGIAHTATAQGAVTPAFFAVSVADLDRSVRWYTETLDLTATRLPASGPVRIALLRGQGLVVEIVEHPDAFQLDSRLPELQRRFLAHGVFKVGFFVTDLDAAVTRLRARGAVFKGDVFTDPVLAARSILLLDNSDNVIQLFEPLPRK